MLMLAVEQKIIAIFELWYQFSFLKRQAKFHWKMHIFSERL